MTSFAVFFLLPFVFCQFTKITKIEATLVDFYLVLKPTGGADWECYFHYNNKATKVDCGGTDDNKTPGCCNYTITSGITSTDLEFTLNRTGASWNGSHTFDLNEFATLEGTPMRKRAVLRFHEAVNEEDAGNFSISVKLDLEECASRKSTTNCSSPLDTVKCYAQPTGGLCDTSCPAGFDKGEGVCVRAACRFRTQNTTATSNICGEQCYGHGKESCVESCPQTHYNTEANKNCTLKDCLSRVADDGARNPCGDGPCYKQPSGDQCNTSCPDKYSIGARGTCTLGSCAGRAIDESAKYPCGSKTCNRQPYSPVCAEDCPALHYEPDGEGTCVLKPCRSRQVDQDARYTCGDAACTELPSGKCW